MNTIKKIIDWLETTMVGSWAAHFGITLGAGIAGGLAGWNGAAWMMAGAYAFREYTQWNPPNSLTAKLDAVMDVATPVGAALTVTWASGFLSGLF